MNYISVGFWICVDADCARGFVPTTSDIKDLASQAYFVVGIGHAQQSVLLIDFYVAFQLLPFRVIWFLLEKLLIFESCFIFRSARIVNPGQAQMSFGITQVC